MRMHMTCANDRISPGNLGIHHYHSRRGQSILEEASDRSFHALHHYKVDYVDKRDYANFAYYEGNVRLYAFAMHIRH